VSKFVGGAESVEMGEDLAPLRDILQPLIDVLLAIPQTLEDDYA
jgi:hypothetical protein